LDFDINITGFEEEEITKNNIVDINELLSEVDMRDAVEKPIWATIRTKQENKDVLEKALHILEENGIKAERSYE
jgi:hypothetical protein